ncbi:MAG: hypothetical protein KJ737_24920 [Proteobacteria bacterium]|nr:hypothetical protein [Pseudomonadota bacterium]
MKPNHVTINPSATKNESLEINDELVNAYSLEKWARDFNLMTAGYRDQLDPDDILNPEVPVNLVTMVILGEAKARVFKRKTKDPGALHVHIGGETRPHTQDFIKLLSRVYAANGFYVHLRSMILTTPIWYSSFGVFYEDFQSGDNLTASHSQYFKGGWKPLDSFGKQLVEEESDIIKEVNHIVESRATIQLAPMSDAKILHDFDVDDAYIRYQKTVVDEQSINEIKKASKQGFRCSICTVGGSMKKTSEKLFQGFGISTGPDGIIQYFLDDEDSQYHGIGQINGENYGVDPTKKEIYRNIGAQEKLIKGEAAVIFIWDPDGDRFNMVTTASKRNIDRFKSLGLEVEQQDKTDKCIVYFTPNQIFFMLVAYRMSALKRDGSIGAYDWFIASSVTTSRALDELAEKENFPIVHVRVGFKHWGTFAHWLESRKDADEPYITALGDRVAIGKKPRLILMCEESGGAIFGGNEFLMNKLSSNAIIAMREKDAFQFGLLSLSLGAFLYNSSQSFADYYCDLIEKYNIRNRFFKRYDKRLYDESLSGAVRENAKKIGEAKRDRIMKYFHDLAVNYSSHMDLDEARKEIHAKCPPNSRNLPSIKKISLIGKGGLLEGTFIQFDTFWLVIRSSGTDAVLRYYMNGENKEEMDSVQNTIMNLDI